MPPTMTATLTFDLPADATEHLWAVHSDRLAGAIADSLEQTRAWLKHGHQFQTPEQAIIACRDLLTDVAQLARGEP